jgi:hypothetical protein
MPRNLHARCAPTAVLAVALFAAACADGPAASPPAEPDSTVGRHPSWRRLRALVADATTGRLSVFDAEDDEIVATLDVGTHASVAELDTGNHALALTADRAHFVDAGVSIVDHVDHIHIYKFPPKLRPFALPIGPSARFASNGGWLAGLPGRGPEAAAVLSLREEDVAKSEAPPTLSFEVGAEAPRAVLPLGDRLLVARAGGVEEWPAPAGPPAPLAACDDPRGATSAGPRAALACADGLLFVRPEGGAYATAKVAYPAGLGAPPGRLRAHPTRSTVLGELGLRALMVADADTASAHLLDLPSDGCDAFLEPARGEHAVVLTAEGALVVIELASGLVVRRVEVVAPFDCAATAARPHLAVAPERAYVTDPDAGKLHDVDLNAGRVALTLDVEGTPNEIVLLGLDLRNANVAPGAAHDGF